MVGGRQLTSVAGRASALTAAITLAASPSWSGMVNSNGGALPGPGEW